MNGTMRVRTIAGVAGVVIAAAMAVVTLWMWQRADAAPGDEDATFVPITPCRLFDVRPEFQVGSKATPLGPGAIHTLSVHGNNGKCTGIPSSATAVSLNVTALDATAPTFLTFWPNGATRPDSSSLNPTPGQPPTPNAVTVALSSSGRFDVFNFAGSVNVLADVNGYYVPSSLEDLDARIIALEAAGTSQTVLDRLDALEAKVTALEAANAAQQAEIDALKAKTASMSVLSVDAQPTVRFTGVNVQVVDGSGETDGTVNGKGNLIVGYHENDRDTRTGSHNLIVGPEHSYSSYGGFVAGFNNSITGEYASVSGGSSNKASGWNASVSGGSENTAIGHRSSVSGGSENTALGGNSSVSGGGQNGASGNGASVSGGYENRATGSNSSVSGGDDNRASGSAASVSGGSGNSASGHRSSVSGGDDNTASGSRASILGGRSNEVIGTNSTVSGGVFNNASGDNDAIAGGDNLNCGYADAVLCGEYTSFTAGWDVVD